MDEPKLPISTSQAEDDAADRRQANRRIEDRRKIERVSVRSLLAVLLAGIGIALAAVTLWLQHRLDKQIEAVQPQQLEIQKNIARLREALTVSDARSGANARHLEELERLGPRVVELAESMGKLNARLETGQRPWIVAEARYLVEIANRRLTLERDTKTALAALEAAEERLQALRDPGLHTIRRTLASEIQSLQSVRQPDLSGIAIQLAGAEQFAATLPVLGTIADRYRPENTEESSAPGFARAWQLLRSSITSIISIRRIGEDAVELVSLEEQAVRRHHLQLLLFFARTAAARGDQDLFHAYISNARAWLVQMFDPRAPEVAKLSGQLQELGVTNIEPVLPDISGSLKMLDRLATSTGAVP